MGIRHFPTSSKAGSSTSPATPCLGTGREGVTQTIRGPPPGQAGWRAAPYTCFSSSTEPGFSSFWRVSSSNLCTVPCISPANTKWPISQSQGKHSDWFWPKGSRLLTASIFPSTNGEGDPSSPPNLKAAHQKLPGLDSSPVGSLKITLASIVLRVRDLTITAMLGTLFPGSCFRAAWLQGKAFAELSMSHL